MKKSVLFLALFLMVSIGGCNRDEDLKDTITKGTWRVSYFISGGDEGTSLFNGYVFAFQPDGKVTVTRLGAPPALGNWNEFNYDTRLDLDFGDPGPLQKLDESWVVDGIKNDEVLLHELSAPLNQVQLDQI